MKNSNKVKKWRKEKVSERGKFLSRLSNVNNRKNVGENFRQNILRILVISRDKNVSELLFLIFDGRQRFQVVSLFWKEKKQLTLYILTRSKK